jgi:hypothetical protein
MEMDEKRMIVDLLLLTMMMMMMIVKKVEGQKEMSSFSVLVMVKMMEVLFVLMTSSLPVMNLIFVVLTQWKLMLMSLIILFRYYYMLAPLILMDFLFLVNIDQSINKMK